MFVAPAVLIKKLPCAHRCCHRDLSGRASAKRIQRCSQTYERFSAFLFEHGKFDGQPLALGMDRLVEEFRDAEALTESCRARLVSAIEFFVPGTKACLRRSKEATNG